MNLFKAWQRGLQSQHTSHHISQILRAKQSWSSINPLNYPAFKHICHLNIHQSAPPAWSWEPGQCYQRADAIPESPQAPTCSLPTPKNTHPRAPCASFLVCLFFPSPVCFPAFQWRECHHGGMQVYALLLSAQGQSKIPWAPRAWNRAGRRLVPSGDTSGHLRWLHGIA